MQKKDTSDYKDLGSLPPILRASTSIGSARVRIDKKNPIAALVPSRLQSGSHRQTDVHSTYKSYGPTSSA